MRRLLGYLASAAAVLVLGSSAFAATSDLRVQQTAMFTAVSPGQDQAITVNVANLGPDAVSGVTLHLNVTGASQLILDTSSWNCTATGATAYDCVQPSTSTLFVSTGGVNFRITPRAGNSSSTLTSNASVDSPNSDPDLSNNSSSLSTPIVTPVPYGFHQSVAPNPLQEEATTTYTITPFVGTSDTVVNPVFKIDFAFESLLHQAYGTGWTCTADESQGATRSVTVTCRRPTMTNSTPPITIITVNAGGTTRASITADTPNSGTMPSDTPFTPPMTDNGLRANLHPSMSATPQPVRPNDVLRYTVNVLNNGPDAATNLLVTDRIPPGMTFVGTSGSGWTCTTPSTYASCRLSSLASGATSAVNIDLRAPATPGSVLNIVTASSDVYDPVLRDDNRISNLANVSAATADLSITGSGPASMRIGQRFTDTFTLHNDGPDGVTASFSTSASPSWAVGVICHDAPCFVDLLPGETKTMNMAVDTGTSFPPSTQAVVTATITSAALDSNTANNSASVSTTMTGCPTTVENLRPNGIVVPPGDLNLAWDNYEDASLYLVYFGPQNGCSVIAGQTRNNSYHVTDLVPGGHYAWRVLVQTSSCGEGAVSACASFDVCGATPVEVSPANHAQVPVGNVTFSWNPVVGATGYNLYVWRVSTPQPNTPTATTTGATSATVNLTSSTYNWVVEATFTSCAATSSEPSTVVVGPGRRRSTH